MCLRRKNITKVINCRLQGKFSELYAYADKICAEISDEELKKSFLKCYFNTLETTLHFNEDGAFVVTGDIPAMWLRDSSVQVSHYVEHADTDPDTNELLKQILSRQFRYIIADPYANAFNISANGKGHKDLTERNPLVWERKFEIDSLIYPMWLLLKFFKSTHDEEVFDELFFEVYATILTTLKTEQHHFELSKYRFVRPGSFKQSLPDDGVGNACAYTGMVWSGFRASDDLQAYAYNIPENMFAVATLRRLISTLDGTSVENPYRTSTLKFCKEIESGINRYGIIDYLDYGRIYAYEVDGMGGVLLMDDANVPSLLSMPYLGFCEQNDTLYQSTRRFVLSEDNPYFFSGKAARGVGSPHTPKDYIWHIALVMEALTSDNQTDKDRLLGCLMRTTAGTGYMHESFLCSNAKRFTRPWFAWANTLFAILVEKEYGKMPNEQKAY